MYFIAKDSTSRSIDFEILDSTSTTGGRKTGLVYNTSSLTAYYHRQGGSATAITLATLAAANSAYSSGGFKEIDATNMPGIYRLDIPDAALATGADYVTITLKGATGMAQVSHFIKLTPANSEALSIDSNGRVDVIKIAGTTQTARDIGASVLLSSGTGTGQLSFTSGILKVDVDTIKTNPVVNAGTITFPTGATLASTTNITAGTITTVTTVTNQLTAAQIATGVWQDTTAGDFTVASSIGKSLYTTGAAPGAAGGLFIAGSNAATTVNITGSVSGSVGSVTGAVGSVTGNVGGNVVGSVASVVGAVGSVTGLTASNLDATISSRMATYTQPTGFLAATFPGTVASTTNITGGTITTVTTLTGHTPQTGDCYARLGAPAGASVSADVAAVKAETASIQSDTNDLQTRVPAALTGAGNMKCDALAIDGSTDAADRLQRAAQTMSTVTIGAASTTTNIVTSAISPSAGVTDQFKGRALIFAYDTTTANLRGQATEITASTAGGVLTVTALTTAPASGDVAMIV